MKVYPSKNTLFLSTINMFKSYILWSKIFNWSVFKQKSLDIKWKLNWNDTTKKTPVMETFLVQLQAWKFTTLGKRDSIGDVFFEICGVYRTFALKMFTNNHPKIAKFKGNIFWLKLTKRMKGISRSTHPAVVLKKVPKLNFLKLTGIHLCRSLFKSCGPTTLSKKRLLVKCFLWIFWNLPEQLFYKSPVIGRKYP